MMRLAQTLAAALSAAALASPVLAEGVLNIFNWGDYTNPDLIRKFEETHDVKVTITDYDPNETALAKVRQGGHGFDIAVPSQSHLPLWIAEGLLLETRPDQMENFRNVLPEWADPPFDPGRHYSVPWQYGTVGIAVDTSVYEGDIDSWSILFDPPEELKGKINIVPEMNDVIYAAIAYNGGKLCDDDREVLRRARDTLVAAKPNWASVDYDALSKMVAGDIAASSDFNGSVFRQRLRKPEVRYGYPREGFPRWSDNVVVLKDAQNVENARLFQNFIMDPENAALITIFARYSSAIAGVEAFLPPEMQDAPELVIPPERQAVAVTARLCDPETQELYSRIWTEVLK